MVVWLRETLDAAQRDAEAADAVDPAPWTADVNPQGAPERFRSGRPDTGAGMIKDAEGDDLWDCEGSDTLCMTGASARHAARHNPHAVLRRITADRELLDDLLAEQHTVACDPFYTCEAATEERDGGANPMTKGERPCDCGRDNRVERRVGLLAEGWGWTEETAHADAPT
jgi:hypothetical protein